MKKQVLASLIAATSAAAFALPTITPGSVHLTQDGSRKVTIEYDLRTEPAIVTIDIQTNTTSSGWVSIGEQNLTNLCGAVNRLVKDVSGTSRAYWQPKRTFKSVDGVIRGARAVVTAWATNCPPNYMVVDLQTKDVTYYVSTNAVPGGVQDRRYKTTSLVMRKIPASGVQWNMGAPSSESGYSASYEALHPVIIDYDYYIAIYEMTQAQWKNVGFEVPAACPWKTSDNADLRPVTNVKFTDLRIGNTYTDAPYNFGQKGHQVAGNHLKSMRTAYGIEFDVPSSAEWEFACRAGEGGMFCNGTDSMDDVGWNSANVAETFDAKNLPAVVGLKKPNNWGIYDMHGNVHEFICEYACAVSLIWQPGDPPVVNPASPYHTGFWMMVRGGDVGAAAANCRSARCNDSTQNFNDTLTNYNGIRLWAPAVGAR